MIRDVLVFTSSSTATPDETDETVWTLTARAYFDVSALTDVGFLNFYRLDGAFSARIAVSFGNETQLSGVYRDVMLQIPVRRSTRDSIELEPNSWLTREVKQSFGGRMDMEM